MRHEYVVYLKHDTGKNRLVVHAACMAEAITAVCAAEGCPEHAIYRIDCKYHFKKSPL